MAIEVMDLDRLHEGVGSLIEQLHEMDRRILAAIDKGSQPSGEQVALAKILELSVTRRDFAATQRHAEQWGEIVRIAGDALGNPSIADMQRILGASQPVGEAGQVPPRAEVYAQLKAHSNQLKLGQTRSESGDYALKYPKQFAEWVASMSNAKQSNDETRMPCDNQPSFNAEQQGVESQPGEWVPLMVAEGNVVLCRFGGATLEQAESAAKAIRAMEAMERHGMKLTRILSNGKARWQAYYHPSGHVAWGEDSPADAILSLAEQLEGKETT